MHCYFLLLPPLLYANSLNGLLQTLTVHKLHALQAGEGVSLSIYWKLCLWLIQKLPVSFKSVKLSYYQEKIATLLSIALHIVLLLITSGTLIICFYRAMLAQSAVMRLHVVCLSVCLSVRNVQVPCSNRLEFLENNFTAE